MDLEQCVETGQLQRPLNLFGHMCQDQLASIIPSTDLLGVDQRAKADAGDEIELAHIEDDPVTASVGQPPKGIFQLRSGRGVDSPFGGYHAAALEIPGGDAQHP